MDPTEVDGQFYTLADAEAVRHLFRCRVRNRPWWSGKPILGQVRTAMSAAHNADSIDSVLSKLLHMAIRVGDRPCWYRLSRYSTSIARSRSAWRGASGSSVLRKCWWSRRRGGRHAAQRWSTRGREAAGRKQGLGGGALGCDATRRRCRTLPWLAEARAKPTLSSVRPERLTT